MLQGRTYTPGFSDELGVRRIAHGAPGEPPLEVLEFIPWLADAPGFERALRARVDALRDVNPVSLAPAYAVERPDGSGLCLISGHVAGRRLSEIGTEEWGGALALDLIHTVTPVLEALNHSGVGVAHGALSANRIIVSTDSRLVVVEHVLGWAIESLRFPRARLHELGMVVPGGFDPVRFDARTDMVQLGFLALSLWLRRPLEPADCPDKLTELLDEAVTGDDSPHFAGRLRAWLERALQIGPRPFTFPQAAIEAFHELPGEATGHLSELVDEDVAPGGVREESAGPSDDHDLRDEADPAFNVAKLRAAIEQRHTTPEPSGATSRRFGRTAWILGVLAVIALGEAVAVGWVAYNRSRVGVTQAGALESQTVAASSEPVSSPVVATPDPQISAPRAANVSSPSAGAPAPAVATPANAPVGKLTIASAMELGVFEGGAPIGSTSAPMTLRQGTHELVLVNESIGFRQTQEVNIRNAQMSTIRVTMPPARISLNATPWAEVTIDGETVGETPIANRQIPAGSHEIVFRHPELGERRQTVVIKVGAHMHVTQTFDRGPIGSTR